MNNDLKRYNDRSPTKIKGKLVSAQLASRSAQIHEELAQTPVETSHEGTGDDGSHEMDPESDQPQRSAREALVAWLES